MRQMGVEAWRRTCLYIEGLATASTIAGLGRLGLFDRLEAGSCPRDAAIAGLNPAYAGVGLRLLDHLSWFDRQSLDQGLLALSPSGRKEARDWRIYDEAERPQGRPFASEATARMRTDGFLLAPLLLRLRDRIRTPTAGLTILPHVTGEEARRLEAAGLAESGGACLSQLGALAVIMAVQYRHVLSYAPLLARVFALLSGTEVADSDQLRPEEVHLDRGQDIRASGEVYEASCAASVSALARHIATERPFRYLVDIGAGDGTMLTALYRILSPLLPGLSVVAVEPSTVGRATLDTRLAQANVPHFVIAGDVADPAQIHARLRAESIDPRACLVAMKSVLHDRVLRLPVSAVTRVGRSTNPFVGPGGCLASAAWVEADLVACLSAWRAVLGEAGMLLIEAHTTSAPVPAPQRAVTISLEATHGYSHQYLLEADIHLACCADAGFDVSFTPVEERLGYVSMTAAWLTEPRESGARIQRVLLGG